MKSIYLVTVLFASKIILSQTAYSTSFNAGHGWTLNTFNNLNTNAVNEGTQPNIWYVSDKESNKGVGNRGGANCGNTTLHIGSTSIGDNGAAFDAGGCTNFGLGPCASCVTNGLYCVVSDRSAESPLINTSAYSALNLSFVYIHRGTNLLDNGEIIYSINSGTTWIKLADVPKSICCSGGASCLTGCTTNTACSGTHQGQWQSYSAALPAACLGISTLKVGFRWYNDDVSTSAKDPSIAVDDITLFDPALPISLVDFYSVSNSSNVKLNWKYINHGNFDRFIVERSADAAVFTQIAEFEEKTDEKKEVEEFSYTDEDVVDGSIYYYRLRCIDKDNSLKMSNIVSGKTSNTKRIEWSYDGNNLTITNDDYTKVEVMDVTGKVLISQVLDKSNSNTKISTTSLSKGMFLLKASSTNYSRTVKINVW